MRQIYFNTYNGFSVYDLKEDCQFCPVRKGSLVSLSRLDVFIGPFLLPKLLKNLKTTFFIGPNIFFNNTHERDATYFNGKHPRTAEVINSLGDAVNPVNFSLSYGGFVGYKSVYLEAKYTPSIKLSESIEVFDGEWLLNNHTELLQLKLGFLISSLWDN
ncbi:MAG: hypothetical protein ACNS60_02300 [Candidatus Cyclobacteriaceae bacterium M2_1C_046]